LIGKKSLSKRLEMATLCVFGLSRLVRFPSQLLSSGLCLSVYGIIRGLTPMKVMKDQHGDLQNLLRFEYLIAILLAVVLVERVISYILFDISTTVNTMLMVCLLAMLPDNAVDNILQQYLDVSKRGSLRALIVCEWISFRLSNSWSSFALDIVSCIPLMLWLLSHNQSNALMISNFSKIATITFSITLLVACRSMKFCVFVWLCPPLLGILSQTITSLKLNNTNVTEINTKVFQTLCYIEGFRVQNQNILPSVMLLLESVLFNRSVSSLLCSIQRCLALSYLAPSRLFVNLCLSLVISVFTWFSTNTLYDVLIMTCKYLSDLILWAILSGDETKKPPPQDVSQHYAIASKPFTASEALLYMDHGLWKCTPVTYVGDTGTAIRVRDEAGNTIPVAINELSSRLLRPCHL
jgi:hypothetical protein